jgi:hypothetical protein
MLYLASMYVFPVPAMKEDFPLTEPGYGDDTVSCSLNEITIYRFSPAVFALAYLCDKSRPDESTNSKE